MVASRYSSMLWHAWDVNNYILQNPTKEVSCNISPMHRVVLQLILLCFTLRLERSAQKMAMHHMYMLLCYTHAHHSFRDGVASHYVLWCWAERMKSYERLPNCQRLQPMQLLLLLSGRIEPEYGRSRVFAQWLNTEDELQAAIGEFNLKPNRHTTTYLPGVLTCWLQ